MAETIFALSSGAPPAAIAVIRITGPAAGMALTQLAGRLPLARRAVMASLRTAGRGLLDQAIVLWLPGPTTATGEDMAELHCHGGRAVAAAVLAALAQIPGLRAAGAGEFTRRAFANGRIDLAEAEGLADLLLAETELQRSAAVAMAGGDFSQVVNGWRQRLLAVSAQVEALLDFSDEDDVAGLPTGITVMLAELGSEIAGWLDRPRAELLRDGFRVVITGPPNAGKSTLFNALVEADAAITAPIPGTTRDVLTRAVAIAGVPFVFADTAGLRDDAGDAIEAIGIDRARQATGQADLVLWLGAAEDCPGISWDVDAQVDRSDIPRKRNPRHRLSALHGVGMDELRQDLITTARAAMPKPGAAALNARQHGLLAKAGEALARGGKCHDLLLTAEELRQTRVAFDALVGRSATEDMLDALFGQFCIGK